MDLNFIPTIEDRHFYVREDVTKELIRIGVCPYNPCTIKSQWEPGIIRKACDEVLTRMNIAKFQQIKTKTRLYVYKMVINIANEALKEFILGSAIQEAVSILLKPSCDITKILGEDNAIGKCTELNEVLQDTSDPNRDSDKQRYFITKMASIAWDFLNISNIFPEEI